MSLKTIFIDLLKDERGNISVKPMIAVFSTIILTICLFYSVVRGLEISESSHIIDGFIIIICTCIGGDSIDKFSFKNNKES